MNVCSQVPSAINSSSTFPSSNIFLALNLCCYCSSCRTIHLHVSHTLMICLLLIHNIWKCQNCIELNQTKPTIENLHILHVHVYLPKHRPSSYEWQEITHLDSQDAHVFASEKSYVISKIISPTLLVYLNPEVRVPSRNTTVSNISKKFYEHKERVKLAMHKSHSRICLTQFDFVIQRLILLLVKKRLMF